MQIKKCEKSTYFLSSLVLCVVNIYIVLNVGHIASRLRGSKLILDL